MLFSLQTAISQNIELSEKHKDKINKATTPERKLKLYKKFYTKDSARHARKTRKLWKERADSLSRVADNHNIKIDSSEVKDQALNALEIDQETNNLAIIEEFQREREESLLVAKVKEKALEKTKELEKPDFVDETLAIKPDSTIKEQAIEKAKQELDEVEKPEEVNELLAVKGLKLDSGLRDSTNQAIVKQKAVAKAESELRSQEEFAALDKNKASASELKNDYFNTSEIPLDSGKINKEQALEMAKEEAMQLAQKSRHFDQLNKLKGKYSKVVNSNDLSTAVKRNSLKGEPLGNRMVLGGNFNILETKPLTVDLSASIGYKLSKKWITGIHLNHRLGSPDSVSISGGRWFVNFDLAKGFFAASEFEMMHKKIKNEEVSSKKWQPGFFLGIGRKMKLFNKVQAQVALMYNFIHDNQAGIYDKPLVIRFGFNWVKE